MNLAELDALIVRGDWESLNAFLEKSDFDQTEFGQRFKGHLKQNKALFFWPKSEEMERYAQLQDSLKLKINQLLTSDDTDELGELEEEIAINFQAIAELQITQVYPQASLDPSLLRDSKQKLIEQFPDLGFRINAAFKDRNWNVLRELLSFVQDEKRQTQQKNIAFNTSVLQIKAPAPNKKELSYVLAKDYLVFRSSRVLNAQLKRLPVSFSIDELAGITVGAQSIIFGAELDAEEVAQTELLQKRLNVIALKALAENRLDDFQNVTLIWEEHLKPLLEFGPKSREFRKWEAGKKQLNDISKLDLTELAQRIADPYYGEAWKDQLVAEANWFLNHEGSYLVDLDPDLARDRAPELLAYGLDKRFLSGINAALHYEDFQGARAYVAQWQRERNALGNVVETPSDLKSKLDDFGSLNKSNQRQIKKMALDLATSGEIEAWEALIHKAKQLDQSWYENLLVDLARLQTKILREEPRDVESYLIFMIEKGQVTRDDIEKLAEIRNAAYRSLHAETTEALITKDFVTAQKLSLQLKKIKDYSIPQAKASSSAAVTMPGLDTIIAGHLVESGFSQDNWADLLLRIDPVLVASTNTLSEHYVKRAKNFKERGKMAQELNVAWLDSHDSIVDAKTQKLDDELRFSLEFFGHDNKKALKYVSYDLRDGWKPKAYNISLTDQLIQELFDLKLAKADRLAKRVIALYSQAGIEKSLLKLSPRTHAIVAIYLLRSKKYDQAKSVLVSLLKRTQQNSANLWNRIAGREEQALDESRLSVYADEMITEYRKPDKYGGKVSRSYYVEKHILKWVDSDRPSLMEIKVNSAVLVEKKDNKKSESSYNF